MPDDLSHLIDAVASLEDKVAQLTARLDARDAEDAARAAAAETSEAEGKKHAEEFLAWRDENWRAANRVRFGLNRSRTL